MENKTKNKLKQLTADWQTKHGQSRNLPDTDGTGLPKGWKIKKLGEVCEVQRGLTYSGKDVVDYSENIVLRATNINLENNSLDYTELKYLRNDFHIQDKYKLKKGSILICFSSGSKSHLGKVALVDNEYRYSFGGFIGQITPQKEIASKYLFYSLISENYKQYISELTDGVNINNLKIKDLQNFQIPLPPLPEQKRIVSILDRAFKAIDQAKAHAQQNRQNAKELFQSKLQAIFDNGQLKVNSGEWEEKIFDELVKYKQIGLIRSSKEQKADKKYRYLKMDAISNENLLLHDKYVFVDASLEEIEKYKLDIGDFLFNTRNSYELVGKTCVFLPLDDEVTLFNNNIMRVKFLNIVVSKFINYAFSSDIIKERLEKLKSGTTSVVGIYYKGLKNLKIPIPSLKTQKQIVAQLDELQAETKKLEAIYQKKIDNLEALKKSILQKAFRGEL